MKFLVSGLLPYDSGKTEFVIGLIDGFLRIGYNPGYFKPLAGHNGWYQYETLLHTIDSKLLIGHDAYVVAKRLNQLDKLSIINPLDILGMPIDPLLFKGRIRLYVDDMSSLSKTAVLMRLSRNIREPTHTVKPYHVYFFFKDTYMKLSIETRSVLKEVLENIRTNKNTLFVEAEAAFLEKILSNPSIYSSLDENIKYLEEFNPLIIESFNDAAAPTYGSLMVDIVFIVSPGKALLYSGERYRKAVEVYSYKGDPWSIKTSNILDLLGSPMKSYDIPLKIQSDKYLDVFDNIVEFISSENY